MTEQEIKQGVINKFKLGEEAVTVARERRIFAQAPRELFSEMLSYIIDDLKFSILCTITGTDEGANFGVMYHLASEKGIVLNLHLLVPKDNPVIKTVTARFPAAEMYEREMVDLLGIKVEGLAPGKRYPLPDEWPADNHPLRKDWKPADAGPKPADAGPKPADAGK
jgi:Ni,Fe-hydrogenase III component G